ncbi:unnamed protein product [Aphanomyces euteiches]
MRREIGMRTIAGHRFLELGHTRRGVHKAGTTCINVRVKLRLESDNRRGHTTSDHSALGATRAGQSNANRRRKTSAVGGNLIHVVLHLLFLAFPFPVLDQDFVVQLGQDRVVEHGTRLDAYKRRERQQEAQQAGAAHFGWTTRRTIGE